jgi:CRP/FNR family transcriptional regulator, cyclic AMP receptor protein
MHRDARQPATPAELGLARVVLFTELTEADVASLAARLRRRRCARGEVIFLRDDPGDSLFIVKTGVIRIVLTSPEGKEMTLALRGPGDFFGELALLDGEPRSADAVAQEPAELLLLQRDDFLELVGERPSVAVALIKVLSQRLRQSSQIVEDAAFLDVPARLAIAILRLLDAQGQVDEPGSVIAARLSQAELAALVGTRRESVNRWLRFYEQQGLIRYERGQITVLRPDGLRKRVY